MPLPLLRLFVYGSLKRGFGNHRRYCRGVRSVEVISIPGQLYRLPSGYPGLVLRESRILARGTRNLLADLEAEQGVQRKGVPTGALAGERHVRGELLTFADAADRLRAIDSLEEYHPGHKSRYERVLIEIYSRCRQTEVLAWTYVAGPLSPRRRLIANGRWTG
jgi:gamma-glutamylcyclotransferase (GGCT)/AIG2-like uncharacterized protein YtfP